MNDRQLLEVCGEKKVLCWQEANTLMKLQNTTTVRQRWLLMVGELS